jgi:hypothetical protein
VAQRELTVSLETRAAQVLSQSKISEIIDVDFEVIIASLNKAVTDYVKSEQSLGSIVDIKA